MESHVSEMDGRKHDSDPKQRICQSSSTFDTEAQGICAEDQPPSDIFVVQPYVESQGVGCLCGLFE